MLSLHKLELGYRVILGAVSATRTEIYVVCILTDVLSRTAGVERRSLYSAVALDIKTQSISTDCEALLNGHVDRGCREVETVSCMAS